MYLAHYHLNVKPFQITPDPKFLWLGETHNDALSILKYSLMENRGLLLLVGDVGTGKTTLVNKLLESISETTIVATVQYPGLEILDFYNFLSTSFNMGKRFATKGDFLVRFIHFLHKSHTEKRKVLLILDEAQGLSSEILEEVRLLSNIERMNTKLLNIFLVGQNEVDEILAEPANRALSQRIATRHYMGPIQQKEVKEYIRFRLKVAGTESQIFNAGAIREIIESSKCYPRLINVICDHALLAGYVEGKTKIDATIIRECARAHRLQMIDVQAPIQITNKKSKKKGQFKSWDGTYNIWVFPFILVLFLCMLIVVGYYSYLKNGDDVAPPVTRLKSQSVSSGAVKTENQATDNVVTDGEKKESANTVKIKKDSTDQAQTTELKEEDIGPEIKTDGSKTTEEYPKDHETTVNPVENEPGFVENIRKTPPESYAVEKLIINFPAYSEDIADDATTELYQFLLKVLKHPNAYILIKSYTDSSGKAETNQRLSAARAEKVKKYFVDKGFYPSRVKAVGMGEKDPIVSNSTAAGRDINRRIEIELIH
jgi:general secretion pathway protein A